MRKISFKILSVSAALISQLYLPQVSASHSEIYSSMQEPKVKSLFKQMMQMVPDRFTRNAFAQNVSKLIDQSVLKGDRLKKVKAALVCGDHAPLESYQQSFIKSMEAAKLETAREVARSRQAELAKAAALRQAEEAKAKKEARQLAAAKAAAAKAAAPSYSSAFLNVFNVFKSKLSKIQQGNVDAYAQQFPEHFNTPAERIHTLATLHTNFDVKYPKILKTAVEKAGLTHQIAAPVTQAPAQQPEPKVDMPPAFLMQSYAGGVETIPGYIKPVETQSPSSPKTNIMSGVTIIQDYAVAQPAADMPPAHLMKSYIGGIDTIPGYAYLAKQAAQTSATAKVMSASPLARFASGLFSYFR